MIRGMTTKHFHFTPNPKAMKETSKRVRMTFDEKLGKLRPYLYNKRNKLDAAKVKLIRTLYREEPQMTQQRIASYVRVSINTVNRYVRPVANYKRPSKWLRFNTKSGHVA